MLNPTNSNLSWCAGFFDGEGSFSFAAKCPYVLINNTNPLAVTKFAIEMKKNNVNFKITERSKPSKSSKKKRWDLYLSNNEEIKKFISLMKNYINGKSLQLHLLSNYYEDNNYNNYEDKVNDYNELMKYYNQINNILIQDENKLFNKLGYIPEIKRHQFISEELKEIKTDTYKDIDYLSGIIDAEGSIYINKRQNKKRNTDRFTPWISITNTNKKIIECCCSTLKNCDIRYYIFCRENRNRCRWDIIISGIKRTIKLSELLKNKLIIKNRQLDLIYEYCNSRLLDLVSDNQLGASFKESIEALNKEN